MNADHSKFGDRLNFINPSLAVGRWHNPYFATRLKATYGNFYDHVAFQRVVPGTYDVFRNKHTLGMGQIDFMFDLVNFFSPYREDRFFHVIPFVGVGGGVRLSNTYGTTITNDDHKYSAVAVGGLQLKFRLAKRVDLNLEGQVIANNFRFPSEFSPLNNTNPIAFRRSVLATAGASLTFHLGKKEFTPVVAEDAALLASLNKDLNSLRAENAELAKRPVDCPEPVAPVVEAVSVGNVVYFRINSYKVDPNQMINIRNIAEYAKNNTETITLVGYADRQTGTPEYNYRLSEKRAAAVKDILVKKYGISADRIKTSWEGDRVQPYAENVWNRIVIMNAEK